MPCRLSHRFWHGTTSGTASGDFGHLVVFELDSKCKPPQIGFAEAGLFAGGELVGKNIVISFGDTATR